MSGQVATPKSGMEQEIPAPPLKRVGMSWQRAMPYILLAPAGIFLFVFFAWPMVQALVMAVQAQDGAWTLQHFQRMTSDLAFGRAIRNTLLLVVCIMALQTVLALAMALLLQSGLRGTGFLLYVWAIPLAISDLAAGIVWLAIFTDRGYLNSLLVGLGLSETGMRFLSYESPVSMFFAVVVAEIWRSTSIVMVNLLAGLQVIPNEYGEAASVFGATSWQRFRHVMLPLLRPSLQVALILRTILAFQVFAVAIALAGRNLPVLAGEAYTWYGSYSNPNVAAAYAVLILAFSLVSTAIYLRALRVPDAQVGRG